jgi:predicted porin
VIIKVTAAAAAAVAAAAVYGIWGNYYFFYRKLSIMSSNRPPCMCIKNVKAFLNQKTRKLQLSRSLPAKFDKSFLG